MKLRLAAARPGSPGPTSHGPERRLRLLFGAASVVAHVAAALVLTAWPREPVPLAVSGEWVVALEPVAAPMAATQSPELSGEERREAPNTRPPAPEPQLAAPVPPPAPAAPRRPAPSPPVPRPATLPRHGDVGALPAERHPPAHPAESQPAAMASLRPSAPDAPLVPLPIVPPHPLAGMQGNSPPAYPERSRQRREQGLVLLRVDVSAEGVAASVTVAQSSGYRTLDEAAAATVRRWRFVAATRGGTAVAAVAEVPVQFTLAE